MSSRQFNELQGPMGAAFGSSTTAQCHSQSWELSDPAPHASSPCGTQRRIPSRSPRIARVTPKTEWPQPRTHPAPVPAHLCSLRLLGTQHAVMDMNARPNAR
ncbi:hypothetical protein NDU88_003375 [Pleurodeles waltl]|uniref:Uncharacterized protein n=1 Tax=Pleurodeles waltl TaxID=8319 RepID=A0AAV7T4T4_PLEWA|nr:hypothetical protein NDU88_003375 [Pleurodeles waltl]